MRIVKQNGGKLGVALLLALLLKNVEACSDPFTSYDAPASPAAKTIMIPESYSFTIEDWTSNVPAQCHEHRLSFTPSLDNYPWISISGRTVTINTSECDTNLDGTSVTFGV